MAFWPLAPFVPAAPTGYAVEVFHVTVLVAEVPLSEYTTWHAHKVCPADGAPGLIDHPFGVEGAVNTPVAHVYVLVPDGNEVGVLAAH